MTSSGQEEEDEERRGLKRRRRDEHLMPPPLPPPPPLPGDAGDPAANDDGESESEESAVAGVSDCPMSGTEHTIGRAGERRAQSLAKALLALLASDCGEAIGECGARALYLKYLTSGTSLNIDFNALASGLGQSEVLLDAFFQTGDPSLNPKYFNVGEPSNLFRLQHYVLPPSHALVLIACTTPYRGGLRAGESGPPPPPPSPPVSQLHILHDGRTTRGPLAGDCPPRLYVYILYPARKNMCSTYIKAASQEIVNSLHRGSLSVCTNLFAGRYLTFRTLGLAFAHCSGLTLTAEQSQIQSVVDLLIQSGALVDQMQSPIIVYVVRGTRLHRKKCVLDKVHNLDMLLIGCIWREGAALPLEQAKCLLVGNYGNSCVFSLQLTPLHHEQLVLAYLERTLVDGSRRREALERTLTRKSLVTALKENYSEKRRRNLILSLRLKIVRLRKTRERIVRELAFERQYNSAADCGCRAAAGAQRRPAGAAAASGEQHITVCLLEDRLPSVQSEIDSTVVCLEAQGCYAESGRNRELEEEGELCKDEAKQRWRNEDGKRTDSRNPCSCQICLDACSSVGADVSLHGSNKPYRTRTNCVELLQLLGLYNERTGKIVRALCDLTIASFDCETRTNAHTSGPSPPDFYSAKKVASDPGGAPFEASQTLLMIGYTDTYVTSDPLDPHYALFRKDEAASETDYALVDRFLEHILARQECLEREKRSIAAELFAAIAAYKAAHLEFYERHPEYLKNTKAHLPERTWRHTIPGLLEKQLTRLVKSMKVFGYNSKR